MILVRGAGGSYGGCTQLLAERTRQGLLSAGIVPGTMEGRSSHYRGDNTWQLSGGGACSPASCHSSLTAELTL